MTDEKKEIALIIGNNVKEQFKKIQDNFDGCTCEICGQKLPNPYTQGWLAININVSKPTLCHILQGKRLPTLEQIVMLAYILNCTVDDLLINAKEKMYIINV
tara:strand:+ start:593 stop:898 length:306 start_codon:yes stop_codon:yes gene_type:complete